MEQGWWDRVSPFKLSTRAMVLLGITLGLPTLALLLGIAVAVFYGPGKFLSRTVHKGDSPYTPRSIVLEQRVLYPPDGLYDASVEVTVKVQATGTENVLFQESFHTSEDEIGTPEVVWSWPDGTPHILGYSDPGGSVLPVERKLQDWWK